MLLVPSQYQWGIRDIMISVAVKGYGIVIWDGDGRWRTFTTSDAMSATLAARVELALAGTTVTDDERTVMEALLSITGAHLFAVDCDHDPGECPGKDFAS